jgi:hypothetical protein
MFNAWSSFFALTGSSGATLLGLLFVVVTLGTNLETSQKHDVARALLTPALYSFAGVMLQSMVALAPWPSNWQSGAILLVMGIAGLIYRIRAVLGRRQVHLKAIRGPVDLIFHNVFPVAASLILIAGGAGLIAGAAFAPFAVAVSSTLFLVSGIYRTWGETLVLTGTRGDS